MHPGVAEPGGRHAVAMSLFGIGPCVTSALSSRLTAEVRRDGVRWVQEYARGVALAPPTSAGPTTRSGTTIAFWPDTDIFETTECSFAVLAERFRELAFLNRGLDISLTDERPGAGPDRCGTGSRAGLGTSSPSSTRRKERPCTRTPSASSANSVILSEGVIAADGPTGGIVADEELLAQHRLELPFGFVPSSAA